MAQLLTDQQDRDIRAHISSLRKPPLTHFLSTPYNATYPIAMVFILDESDSMGSNAT